MAINKLDTGAIQDNAITNAKMADDAVGVADLAATGTPSSTTFLRGDNAWVTPTDTNTTYSVQDGELSQNNFTNDDHTKLNNIEASADVTDATNVAAAGALMDSELAGIAAVKATTGTFLTADQTKLDGIATSANNYVHPNHSGDVVSAADGAMTIQTDAVDIAMLSATGTPSATTFLRGDNAWTTVDTTTIENNIAMLGFYRAADHSKAKYNLVDQVIDDYNDATGIDAGASTNETLTSGYYSGSSTSAGTPVQHLGSTGASGSIQSFTVPANVTSLALKAWGAAGGTGTNGGRGGGGGFASGNLAVTAGQVIKMVAGNGGATSNNGGAASFGGGGNTPTGGASASGGGYAGFFLTSVAHGNAKLIAGGGGGSGYTSSQRGGFGGGNAGTSGTGASPASSDGGGGTQSAGGTVASNGENGSALQGGGSGNGNNGNCGGGGGGYYGGASGKTSTHDGSGGGGSGYIGGVTSGVNTAASSHISAGDSDSDHPGGMYGSVSTSSNSNGNGGAVRIEYNVVTPVDVTLQSTDSTASTAPTSGDMVTLIENSAGTATLNTDIKGYISRDSGANFTQGTLVDEGSWGTNKKILAFHDLDISGQPSGTAMCYKITTHNQSASKDTKIHATSLAWA